MPHRHGGVRHRPGDLPFRGGGAVSLPDPPRRRRPRGPGSGLGYPDRRDPARRRRPRVVVALPALSLGLRRPGAGARPRRSSSTGRSCASAPPTTTSWDSTWCGGWRGRWPTACRRRGSSCSTSTESGDDPGPRRPGSGGAAGGSGVEVQPRQKILVIDDEEVVLDSCLAILAGGGYDITTATNGEEGLRLAAELSPDLVFVDVKMPGIPGMEVLERLRAADPTTVAIVITGYATVSLAVEAMKRGAFDFLPKPFTPDEFREMVRRGLERRVEKLAQARERAVAEAAGPFPGAAAGPMAPVPCRVLGRWDETYDTVSLALDPPPGLARLPAGPVQHALRLRHRRVGHLHQRRPRRRQPPAAHHPQGGQGHRIAGRPAAGRRHRGARPLRHAVAPGLLGGPGCGGGGRGHRPGAAPPGHPRAAGQPRPLQPGADPHRGAVLRRPPLPRGDPGMEGPLRRRSPGDPRLGLPEGGGAGWVW